MTEEQVISLIKFYADLVYKGYYVHKKDVEDILETLDAKKVIEEWLKSPNNP